MIRLILTLFFLLYASASYAGRFTYFSNTQFELLTTGDTRDREALFSRSGFTLSTLDIMDLGEPNPYYFEAFVEAELEATEDHSYADPRQFYLQTGWQNLIEVSAGQRVIIWGRADGLNPTDVVNHEDFSYFLIYDKERRKRSRPMATAKLSAASSSLTLVALPTIHRHILPTKDSNWCKGDCQDANALDIREQYEEEGIPVEVLPMETADGKGRTDYEIQNEQMGDEWEYAARLDNVFPQFEFAGVYHYGISKYPIYMQTEQDDRILVEEIKDPHHAVGGDFALPLGPIVLRGEGMLHIQRTFVAADPEIADEFTEDGTLEADELEVVLGLEWQLFWQLVSNTQVFRRELLNSPADVVGRRDNQLVSFDLRRPFFNEDLLIVYRLLSDTERGSFYHQPKFDLRFWQYGSIGMAGHVFQGEEGSFFGSQQENNGVSAHLGVVL